MATTFGAPERSCAVGTFQRRIGLPTMTAIALQLVPWLPRAAAAAQDAANAAPANTAGSLDDLISKIVLAVAGGVGGFLLNWFLVERKEWYELHRSIAPARADSYRALWPICRRIVEDAERATRAIDLRSWYEQGGGLFLSLRASQRYFAAIALLERKGELTTSEFKQLGEHLTWLRTEMKYHVGSYSRRDAKTQIPITTPERTVAPSGAPP